MSALSRPWINYHHLYYFKIIAEEGSVSKAAEKLRLGQPTLSAQLKQFEDTLGVQLFDRQHKRLILNDQGKIALDYARSIFKMGFEMFEVLHDQATPSRPNLGVGALDSVPKQVILQLMQKALKITRCHISLIEGRPEELLRELMAHRIDLLITNFVPTATEAKGLMHRSIAKNRVSLYGAPRFKELRKGFPESIRGQPVILPTYDSRLRYDVDHWSEITGIQYDLIGESQDIAVKKLIAINGIALLPAAAHTVTRQVLAGELIEIGVLKGVEEELFLMCTKRRVENVIAKELMRQFAI